MAANKPPTSQLQSGASIAILVAYLNKISTWIKQKFSGDISYANDLASEIVTTKISSDEFMIPLKKSLKPVGLIVINSERFIKIDSWLWVENKIRIKLYQFKSNQVQEVSFLVIYK